MRQENTSAVPEVDRQQVLRAVEALMQIDSQNRKSNLFSDSEPNAIDLQFSFVKAPTLGQNKTIKVPLPHSLHHDTTDVCLFVKDLDASKRDYTPTIDHFEGLLKEKDVTCITEIIPLKSLKTEYKPFEAKSKLMNQFDVFLADDSIMRLLPSYLGKHFYRRKKMPVQVNLKARDLKNEFSKAIGNTRCQLTGHGSCGMVRCAHTGLSVEQITDNIMTTMKKLASSVPGGGQNLKTFNIKTINSPSVPVMITIKSTSAISLPKANDNGSDLEPDDVTTVEDGKIKVTKKGDLVLLKDDGSKVSLTKKETSHIGQRSRQKRIQGKKKKSAVTGLVSDSSAKKKKVKRLVKKDSGVKPPAKKAKLTAKSSTKSKPMKKKMK